MIIKKIKIKKLIIIGLIGPHNYYEESYNIIVDGHNISVTLFYLSTSCHVENITYKRQMKFMDVLLPVAVVTECLLTFCTNISLTLLRGGACKFTHP